MKAKRKASMDKSAVNEGTAAPAATAQEVAGCPAAQLPAGVQANSNAAGEAGALGGRTSPAAERSANAASTSSPAPDGSDPNRPVRVYADGE